MHATCPFRMDTDATIALAVAERTAARHGRTRGARRTARRLRQQRLAPVVCGCLLHRHRLLRDVRVERVRSMHTWVGRIVLVNPHRRQPRDGPTRVPSRCGSTAPRMVTRDRSPPSSRSWLEASSQSSPVGCLAALPAQPPGVVRTCSKPWWRTPSRPCHTATWTPTAGSSRASAPPTMTLRVRAPLGGTGRPCLRQGGPPCCNLAHGTLAADRRGVAATPLPEPHWSSGSSTSTSPTWWLATAGVPLGGDRAGAGSRPIGGPDRLLASLGRVDVSSRRRRAAGAAVGATALRENSGEKVGRRRS